MFSKFYDQNLPATGYQALQWADSHRPGVTRLNHPEIKGISNIIPYGLLFTETTSLELKLRRRANSNGYRWLGCEGLENRTVSEDNYAHTLEHAILAVIENNLSPCNAGGVGMTETELINDQTGWTIPPLTELPKDFSIRITISLLLSRSIPKRLHQYYVDQVIRKMKENFTLHGELRLNEIVLD